MFRAMRRFKQAVSDAECRKILAEEPRGVLCVQGDDGPYGMPMNHFYDEESGNLYFHGALTGHRMDSLKKCDKVCFTVYDKGFVREGEWALNIKSVIVFGRMRVIEDNEKRLSVLKKLGMKFYPTEEGVIEEINKSAARAAVFELVPEHITGKLVNES